MTNPEKNSKGNNPPVNPRIINWLFLLGVILILAQLLYTGGETARESDWQSFKKEMLAKKAVEKIEVINKERVEVFIRKELLGKGDYQSIAARDPGPHYYFTIGSIDVFEQRLEAAMEEFQLAELPELSYTTRTSWLPLLLSWILPLVIIIAVWVFILRRAGRSTGGLGGRNPFDFGKSKAELFDASNKATVSFADVAGLKEAKVEIMEIVDFLKTPGFYTRLGAKIPKGVMLIGPPGTGKTLLARAVAGEAKVPFFSLSGSEFVEMFVGVGASRVRDLFKKAKEKAPSIIFIDEIDAVGRSRGKAFSLQSNDERESTLNQLLTEMDGFGKNPGVIVMAATNRPDILDKALLRPGRFDRHIYLELPNLEERNAIFKVHTKELKLADNIDLDTLSAQTPGFSGADIANICNEAALIAARKKKEAVFNEDFIEAVDRIIGGLERKGKIISKKEKRIIAFHEAGHAAVSWYLPNVDELVKVTIVPRGKSLGAAWYLPEEHQILTTAQFTDRLSAALGGRAAEELIFSEVSSGALDDLEKVTKQAYTMVAYYGLNEKLGNTSFYDSTGEYQQSLHKPYSEATAQLIDEEVRKLVKQAYDTTLQILTEHKEALIELAELLLEKEVLYKSDLEKIFGQRVNKDGKYQNDLIEL